MDLRLHASDEPADLHAGVADAAIRYGHGEYPGMQSERLLQDVFAPVCHPSLPVREVRDLLKHTMIHFEWRKARRENPTWSRWLKKAGAQDLAPKADLILTDESQAIQAAVAGHGVALLSLTLVADELARGTLIQPFGPMIQGYQYSLVYVPEAAQSERIKALRAWIYKELTPPKSAQDIALHHPPNSGGAVHG
jgi:LysR family glycine cleavage system transcriptional activator